MAREIESQTICWIETDDHLRMNVDTLRGALTRDRADGFEPLMVVGTAGSMNTGAVDLLPALADVCRQENSLVPHRWCRRQLCCCRARNSRGDPRVGRGGLGCGRSAQVALLSSRGRYALRARVVNFNTIVENYAKPANPLEAQPSSQDC